MPQEAQPILRTNSAILICGSSGSGKSSLIATYADWVWKNFKKITLLYSCDGGGFPDLVLTRIHKGIIWVWRMPTRSHPFATFDQATKGYWPAQLNPQTGDSAPSCKLVPPQQTTYKLICVCGKVLRSGTNRAAVARTVKCSSCNTQVGSGNATITVDSIRTPGFEDIGGVAFDGLTSMQFEIMIDLAQRHAGGEIKGAESALGGKIIDEDMFFGGNNQSHYGFAQLRAQEWITKSTTIPGLVAPPLWTALERQADDSLTNLPIYGPKVAGKAVTSDVPQWVGDCLGTYHHVDSAKGKHEYRLYLREYRLSDNVSHVCKTRVLSEYITEDYLSDGEISSDTGPSGKAFTKFNIGHYFDLVINALGQAIDKVSEEFPDAPGLPPGGVGNGAGEQDIGKEDLPKSKDEPKPPSDGLGSTNPKTSAPAPTKRNTLPPGRRPLRTRPNN